MSIATEVILEAAEIINKFPEDTTVLREQKRIINTRINQLIAAAEPSLAADGTTAAPKSDEQARR